MKDVLETVAVIEEEKELVGTDGVPFSDFKASDKAQPDYGVTHKPHRLFNNNSSVQETP